MSDLARLIRENLELHRQLAVWRSRAEYAEEAASSPEDTVRERAERLRWASRRMLQALDAYWLGCDGLPAGRYPRGSYESLDWWNRYERYRAIVEQEARDA